MGLGEERRLAGGNASGDGVSQSDQHAVVGVKFTNPASLFRTDAAPITPVVDEVVEDLENDDGN